MESVALSYTTVAQPCIIGTLITFTLIALPGWSEPTPAPSRLIGTESGSCGLFLGFLTHFLSGLSEGLGVDEVEGSLGPGLKTSVNIPTITNVTL